jgi:isopentenyldiphosphate isomerase
MKESETMEETLILVDENDNKSDWKQGKNATVEKERCIEPWLFSYSTKGKCYSFNREASLSSCGPILGLHGCYYVYPNETYGSAAQRALKQELGISATVKTLFAFTYFAPFNNHAENEYCTLLIGEYEGKVNLNSTEVSSFNHTSLSEI